MINRSLLKFADCEDIVPSRTQGSHHREITTLVRQKSHAGSYSELKL